MQEPWNASKPLRTSNGHQVFANRAHLNAFDSMPPQPSTMSKVGNAVARVGITPLLTRNVLNTMAQPKSMFGDTGYSKQAQVEKSLLHLLPDLMQNQMTHKIPLINLPIDMIYYENYPTIDAAHQKYLNSEYADKNVMDKSLRFMGEGPNGQYFIRDLAAMLSDPIFQNAAKAITTTKLPKQLQGYRGHVAADAHANEYGPNYGTTYLDLLQDILNPAYHAGPYLVAPALAGIRADVGIATGHPFYYDNLKDSNGKPKKMTGFSTLVDSYKSMWPLFKKDLNASIRGLGEKTSQGLQFIP